MIEKPSERVNGVDKYAVSRTASKILKELAAAGWTVGEAELLPGYLDIAIKENQKRNHDAAPLLVEEIVSRP